MFGTQDLVVFIVSGLLLNLASGPDSFNYDAQFGSGLTFWLNPAIGALFVSFGIKLALSGRHSAKTLH